MASALSEMVARLQDDVTARNGVPSEGQYETCVRDAVTDFNRRAPMEKVATINVVSGTASYALPVDFSKIIRFAIQANPRSGVLYTSDGIVPVSHSFKERVMVNGMFLVISPTPAYTMARELWYMAAHVLDESESYQDMLADVAGIVHLKAQSKALTLQANKATQESWSYTMGDESITKTQLSDKFREQAKALNDEYLTAVAAYVGPANLRG